MVVYKADILDIELNTGNIARSFLCHNIGKDDTKADRFGVRVFRDGVAESLSGCSIQGYMMRPNGTNLAITGSNTGVSGNEAWVDLPQAAYDYEGQFCLALKLIGGGVTGTIRIIDGMINNTFVDDALVPMQSVPTYQEILAVYDQMVAAKNGSVRFDQSQSLTETQKSVARMNIDAARDSDVSDLKSAFVTVENEVMENIPLFFTPLSKGTYVGAGYTNTSSTKWVYSQKLGGGKITITLAPGWSAQYFKYISDSSGEQIYSTSINPRTIDASNFQFIMSARKTDNTAYTNDELAAFISGTTVTKENGSSSLMSRMDQAESNIEDLQADVDGANGKFNLVVAEFDPETVYPTGAYVIYNNYLRRRKSWDSAPVAEEWIGGHWTTVTTMADEITGMVPLSYFAPFYDATQTYSAGDYVIYNGYIRRAKMDISTPETFTSGHWQTIGTTIFGALDRLEPDAVFGGQMRGMFRFPIYSTDLVIGRLTTTPSSNTTGLRTSIFAIYGPTRVYVSDQTLKVRINEYTTTTTFSNAYKATIRDYASKCDYVVTGTSYPMYIAVGIMKADSSEMTSADLATISGQFSVMAADDTPYADLSMFQSISVSGDSWSAGAVHSIDGAPAKTVSNIGQGWAENMARQHGVECLNFAIGGTSVRTWFNYDGDTSGIGMKGLLAANAVGLYILSLGGSNDWQSGADGARGWDLGDDDPASPTYYMGSISDISGSDYTAYPKTFYGYYGRIIEMIQAHAPNSRIIMTTPNTFPTSSEKCLACYDATAEIAEHYGLPYLDFRRCDYFNYWRDGRDSVTQGADNSIMNDKHPTAAMYSGMGRSVGELIPEIIKENATYFREYTGELVTVPVAWSQVLK